MSLLGKGKLQSHSRFDAGSGSYRAANGYQSARWWLNQPKLLKVDVRATIDLSFIYLFIVPKICLSTTPSQAAGNAISVFPATHPDTTHFYYFLWQARPCPLLDGCEDVIEIRKFLNCCRSYNPKSLNHLIMSLHSNSAEKLSRIFNNIEGNASMILTHLMWILPNIIIHW